MRSAVSQLVTTVLMLHMGLGCCWHHAHACVPASVAAQQDFPVHEAAASGAHENVLVSHRCEAHEHGAPLPTGDGHDGHRHECDGDRCTFVRSKPVSEQDGQPDCCARHVSADLLLPDVHLLSHHVPSDDAAGQGNAVPPVRPHLLFSVLLI
jgi:hypothetical protein